jgi:hypothetical protein
MIPDPLASARPEPENAENNGLAAENAFMERLRRASPREALALVPEGRRRFPRGVHAPEREASYLRALLDLGRRDEARAQFRDFAARYPNAPATAQLRALLGGVDPHNEGDK